MARLVIAIETDDGYRLGGVIQHLAVQRIGFEIIGVLEEDAPARIASGVTFVVPAVGAGLPNQGGGDDGTGSDGAPAPSDEGLPGTDAASPEGGRPDPEPAPATAGEGIPAGPTTSPPAGPRPDPTLRCPAAGCHRVFSRANGLTRHIRETHGERPLGRLHVADVEPPVTNAAAVEARAARTPNHLCPEPGCDVKCMSSEALRKHRDRRHSDRIAGSHPLGKHQCKDCPGRFSTVATLTRHRNEEHPTVKGVLAVAGHIQGSGPRVGETIEEWQQRIRGAAAREAVGAV